MTADHLTSPGNAVQMGRSWQSPRLAVLGEVRSLTEGGSSGTMETSPTCMGMNLSRIMC